MDKKFSLDSRKYNIISQITSFENEKVIEKIEDFLCLIKLQSKYDKNLDFSDERTEYPKNIFIEHNFE